MQEDYSYPIYIRTTFGTNKKMIVSYITNILKA